MGAHNYVNYPSTPRYDEVVSRTSEEGHIHPSAKDRLCLWISSICSRVNCPIVEEQEDVGGASENDCETTFSTLGGTDYNSDKFTTGYTRMPLTNTNVVNERVSTIGAAADTLTTKVDDNDQKEPTRSESETDVVKARVKRHSTKKTSKHDIEECKVDFENETGSDEELEAYRL